MSLPLTLQFDNEALKVLPVDQETRNFVRSNVRNACFSRVQPTAIEEPYLVAVSKNALALLDIHDSHVSHPDFIDYFSGNKILNGSDPAAHCYCGHQFGYFSGQLGDGAAVYLGEVVNSKQERWELQLKGSGMTPYSRSADGRKVLRSSLREFLCSEFMHSINIPTTRAATIVASTKTQVIRDIFYDGNAKYENCGIISRIAPTFLRFGSFEIFKKKDHISGYAGPSCTISNPKEMLSTMLDYTIQYIYPHIFLLPKEKQYVSFFKEVVQRTAKLFALWQCYGFCHGVLNTDNMSIVGVTLDYGPFGFMEHFDRDFVCNGSDHEGRYSFKNQPDIGKWNLQVLADQLETLVCKEELQAALSLFDPTFHEEYLCTMKKKLGLAKKQLDLDEVIIDKLFETMQSTGADFSCTFRCLSNLKCFKDLEDPMNAKVLHQLESYCMTLSQKKRKCHLRIPVEKIKMIQHAMQKDDQILSKLGIPEELIEKEIAKLKQLERLSHCSEEDILRENQQVWRNWLSLYQQRLRDESNGVEDSILEEQRKSSMDGCNVSIVLRNHVAQKAIEYATDKKFDQVEYILQLLQSPFSTLDENDALLYGNPLPPSCSDICVTCSS